MTNNPYLNQITLSRSYAHTGPFSGTIKKYKTVETMINGIIEYVIRDDASVAICKIILLSGRLLLGRMPDLRQKRVASTSFRPSERRLNENKSDNRLIRTLRKMTTDNLFTYLLRIHQCQ